MKIGILTQPLQNNYGGLLQNYALQHILKRMGFDVETIDWRPAKSNPFKELLWKCKKIVLSYIKSDVVRPRYQLTESEALTISTNTHYFIKKYINICPVLARNNTMFNAIDKQYEYDAYIVGSDQVWRPQFNQFLSAMFLGFTNRSNIKRIAYAASFGTSNWEFSNEQTAICGNLAKRFDLITVREQSGIDLCHKYFGVNATYVIDPTMLLNKSDYEKLVENEDELKQEGTLFHYILDPSNTKKVIIEQIATSKGLKPFTIMPKCQAENRTKWDVKHRIEDCVFPAVTSWLRGFMDAKMVVVDSFHGAVFSIIFNKPFWVFANSRRGNARFESLLGLYNLSDRMITLEDWQNNDWDRPIDWEQVNEIRRAEIEKSKKLLYDALNIDINTQKRDCNA